MAALTSLAPAHLALGAGAPGGLFNFVVTSRERAAPAANQMLQARCAHILSFSGSLRVGKIVTKAATNRVLPLLLELGGHAPFIVYDDAEIDSTVDALVGNDFRNAVQVCIAANRVFVQRAPTFDAFCEPLRLCVEKIIAGNGLDDGVDMGPLIDSASVERVSSHVKDALARGDKLVSGGVAEYDGKDGSQNNLCWWMLLKETFRPVFGILGFETEEEALARSNDNTESGLAAIVFTSDSGRATRVSRPVNCHGWG